MRTRVCVQAFIGARIAGCLLFWGSCLFGAEEVQRGPLPDWVHERTLDLSPTTEIEREYSAGYDYLLDDQQILVEGSQFFHHRAVRLRSPSGIEDFTRLVFDYQPIYQTLTLHRLRIHREGALLDRLADQSVSIREQESSMEANHYDGYLTAELLLEDIRVGDIVEWAYSRNGSNPISENYWHESFGVASTIPKRFKGIRLVLPETSHSEFALWTSPLLEAGIVTRDENELVVALEHTHPVEGVSDEPDWYFPYPWFSVGNYGSWETVVNWGVPLYNEVDRLPSDLMPVRDRIAELPDPESQIEASVEYVQETLRYISLSTGLHTYKPYPISDVLQRRYGDCKDNAHILVSLLRSLGVDATPALVHTSMRHTIIDGLPAPDQFDHVIVAIDLPEGDRIWVDPTREYQAGPLRDLFVPRYGYALLIREGETELTQMDGQGFDASWTQVREDIYYADRAEDPVRMEVATTYSGRDADNMRSYLDRESLSAIRDAYQDYYNGIHQEAVPMAPLKVIDDPKLNQIQVLEVWELPNPWEQDSDWEYTYLNYVPYFSQTLKTYPRSLRVKAPYALEYPQKKIHAFHSHYPIPFPMDPEDVTLETPAMRFRFTLSSESDTECVIRYEYETRSDHVALTDLESFKDTMEEVSDYAGYRLAQPWDYLEKQAAELNAADDLPFQANPWTILVSLCYFGVGIGLSLLEGRSPGPPPLVDPTLKAHNENLVGIGGWLLVPVIGFIIVSLVQVGLVLTDTYLFWDASFVTNLITTPDGNRSGLGLLFVLVSLSSPLVLLGFAPLHLRNIFQHKRRVPTGHIGLLLFILGVSVISALCVALEPDLFTEEYQFEVWSDVASAVIGSVIWVSYFRISLRVKLTFTR